MQLATINSPTNASLYEGSAILNNIGLSPLTLAALGLLSRLLDSINKSTHTFVRQYWLRVIELIVLVGLVLGIVGGVNAADDFVKSRHYQPGTLNKAGTGLSILAYILLLSATAFTSFSISHAQHGERRLFTAIVIALPLLLVRLIYSIFSTFTTNKSFNLLSGNPTILLCVALIEEFLVVVCFEGTGLTLEKVVKEEHAEGARIIPSSDSNSYTATQQRPQQGQKGVGGKIMTVLSYTIIGRILTSMMGNREKDIEMQNQQHYVSK
jgi:uncharacterized membrane protein